MVWRVVVPGGLLELGGISTRAGRLFPARVSQVPGNSEILVFFFVEFLEVLGVWGNAPTHHNNGGLRGEQWII